MSMYTKDFPERKLFALENLVQMWGIGNKGGVKVSKLYKINSWQVLMLLLVQEPHLNHSNARKRGLVKLPRRGAQ